PVLVLVNTIDDRLNALELPLEARPDHLGYQLLQHASPVRYSPCDVMYAATWSGTMSRTGRPPATARRTSVAAISDPGMPTHSIPHGSAGRAPPGLPCATTVASGGITVASRHAGSSWAASAPSIKNSWSRGKSARKLRSVSII